MVEHDALVAVERLVKVDALDTLRHIRLSHSRRQGPNVASSNVARPIGFVACPGEHVIPSGPGHVAAHIGAKGLALLPGEGARLAIMPVQSAVCVGGVAIQLGQLQRRPRSQPAQLLAGH